MYSLLGLYICCMGNTLIDHSQILETFYCSCISSQHENQLGSGSHDTVREIP